MEDKMASIRHTQRIGLILSALVLGCQVQFVSPYSADIQKRASDMIAEVTAWEVQMRNAAGTIQDDPRHHDVIATFAKWHGDLEAMAALEAALTPQMVRCDKLAATVAQASKASPFPIA